MEFFRGKPERRLCAVLLAAVAILVFRDEPEFAPILVLLLVNIATRMLWVWLETGGGSMVRLKLSRAQSATIAAAIAAPAPVVRESLCDGCAYARIVRGYERDEILVTCGYPYPPQIIPFPVHDCSDYKAKREKDRTAHGLPPEVVEQELLAAMTIPN